jgi:hypothetical protein
MQTKKSNDFNDHFRTVGPDIQLTSGIAGNTQPNPAIT